MRCLDEECIVNVGFGFGFRVNVTPVRCGAVFENPKTKCQVSKEAALCLKYNFLANAALDRNEVTLAIDYYDKALATGYADQQGVLLVRRGGGPSKIAV